MSTLLKNGVALAALLLLPASLAAQTAGQVVTPSTTGETMRNTTEPMEKQAGEAGKEKAGEMKKMTSEKADDAKDKAKDKVNKDMQDGMKKKY